MKELPVDDTKIFAVFYVLAAVLVGVIAVVMDWSWHTPLMVVGMVFLGIEARRAFRSQAVYIDGEDVLVMPRKGEPVRFALAEVVSARTIPASYRTSWIVLKNQSGGTVRTIIWNEDLTWLMSRMPAAALTEYWKRKVDV